MKTLHIMRHAKSSWDLAGIQDIDRPLLAKGIFNTKQVCDLFLLQHIQPNIIFCSNAARASHTALIMARNLKINTSQISINSLIYAAETSDIVTFISKIPNQYNSVLLIGHNPTFTNLANIFLSNEIGNLSTSGIVSISFDSIDWNIQSKKIMKQTIIIPDKE